MLASGIRAMDLREREALGRLLEDRWMTGEYPQPVLLLLFTPLFMTIAGGAATMALVELTEILGASERVQRMVSLPVGGVAAPAVPAFVVAILVSRRKLASS